MKKPFKAGDKVQAVDLEKYLKHKIKEPDLNHAQVYEVLDCFYDQDFKRFVLNLAGKILRGSDGSKLMDDANYYIKVQ
jgi:hypothetical protein